MSYTDNLRTQARRIVGEYTAGERGIRAAELSRIMQIPLETARTHLNWLCDNHRDISTNTLGEFYKCE